MTQTGGSRRRSGRRLILRFDGEGEDAALWSWLNQQPDREAAAKAALMAAAAGANPDGSREGEPEPAVSAAPGPGAGHPGDVFSVAALADQVAKLINILDRITLGGAAPRPIGMSLGPAEPIRPFQVGARPDPSPGAAEVAVAADATTLDQQVDQKIAKLLRFGDDLFTGDEV